MQHGNEITMALKPLTRFDAAGRSRRAREGQEARRSRLSVFGNALRFRRRGKVVQPAPGFATEIARAGRLTIVRMWDGTVLMLRAGQFSVGG